MVLRTLGLLLLLVVGGCSTGLAVSPGGGPLAHFYLAQFDVPGAAPELAATTSALALKAIDLDLSFYHNPAAVEADRTVLYPGRSGSFSLSPGVLPSGFELINTGTFEITATSVFLEFGLTSEGSSEPLLLRIELPRAELQAALDDLRAAPLPQPAEENFRLGDNSVEGHVLGTGELNGVAVDFSTGARLRILRAVSYVS